MDTYKLPNGAVTDDKQLYLRLWHELGGVVVALIPTANMVSFDPDMTFHVADGGQTVTLPVWFVQALAQNARPMSGHRFRLTTVRSEKCRMCDEPVHTVGAGRTRLYCSDCIVVRTKLRVAEKKEAKS